MPITARDVARAARIEQRAGRALVSGADAELRAALAEAIALAAELGLPDPRKTAALGDSAGLRVDLFREPPGEPGAEDRAGR